MSIAARPCPPAAAQAQLRGLIGDYTGGDEALFSQAFEALDMLNSCLADPIAPPAGVEAAGATPSEPQAAAPPTKSDAPLISFE